MSDPAVGVGIDLLAVDTVVHSEVGTCDSLSVNFKVDGAVGTDEKWHTAVITREDLAVCSGGLVIVGHWINPAVDNARVN